jgi:hypothetical protein
VVALTAGVFLEQQELANHAGMNSSHHQTV